MGSFIAVDLAYNGPAYAAATVRAMPVTADTEADGGRLMPARRPAKIYDVLCSALADPPQKGDTVTVLGTTYKLQSDAYHPPDDPDDLVWRIECHG